MTSGISPKAIIEIARHLAEVTRADGLLFRLFGSCAIHIKCAEKTEILRNNGRAAKDIDAVVARPDVHQFRQLIRQMGWREDIEVTALTDGARLRFSSIEHDLTLDVVTGSLRFNQTLKLEHRLTLDWPTITATDLLLTKYQIAAPTTNDIIDMVALMATFKVTPADESGLCLKRMCDLSSSSWRWYRATVTACDLLGNRPYANIVVLSREQESLIAERAKEIKCAVVSAPKSAPWKIRALL